MREGPQSDLRAAGTSGDPRAPTPSRAVATAQELHREVQLLAITAPAVVEAFAAVADAEMHGAAVDLAEAAAQMRARADRLIALLRDDAQPEGDGRELARSAAVHDLRQTVSVVAGNAEYLRECEVSPATLATLTRVAQCVQAISTLLREGGFGSRAASLRDGLPAGRG